MFVCLASCFASITTCTLYNLDKKPILFASSSYILNLFKIFFHTVLKTGKKYTHQEVSLSNQFQVENSYTCSFSTRPTSPYIFL